MQGQIAKEKQKERIGKTCRVAAAIDWTETLTQPWQGHQLSSHSKYGELHPFTAIAIEATEGNKIDHPNKLHIFVDGSTGEDKKTEGAPDREDMSAWAFAVIAEGRTDNVEKAYQLVGVASGQVVPGQQSAKYFDSANDAMEAAGQLEHMYVHRR